MKLAIIGATGLVGIKLLEIIDEKKIQFDKIITAASSNSKGKTLTIKENKYKIETIEDALNHNPDIAIFSAGSDVSKEWAPIFSKKGTFVIDNSSQWRMDPKIKLIVPEINAGILTSSDKIIANPNCSTIQLVMALKPIHDKFKINRVIISTYQAVSGSGKKGIQQLNAERENKTDFNKYYPHKIDLNLIPHIDDFLENGYTKEEMKIINETKKILNDNDIKITATAVRVPINNVHSESINIELDKEIDLNEIIELFKNAKGIKIEDDKNKYPMPINTHNYDFVRVGRIRKDLDKSNAFNIWISADNIRKGAATNAIQIAEYIIESNLCKV